MTVVIVGQNLLVSRELSRAQKKKWGKEKKNSKIHNTHVRTPWILQNGPQKEFILCSEEGIGPRRKVIEINIELGVWKHAKTKIEASVIIVQTLNLLLSETIALNGNDNTEDYYNFHHTT